MDERVSFEKLLHEISTGNVVGAWTEIQYRTISNQDAKYYVFIDAKNTEALINLLSYFKEKCE